ncbi:MAG: Eco57I restriction-modification methylase domain-containing protein [Desulfobacterales bacterium]|nr:Eco57I restriction-modification methylase domain-containing protein [Desulfobacterales bacterium]
MNLSLFLDKNLFEAGTSFFKQLDIRLNSSSTLSLPLKSILKDKFKSQEIFEKVSAACFLGLVDSSVFDDNLSLFDDGNVTFDQAVEKIHSDYEGMMIFAVRIDGIASPTRTQLADLTRAFNRASKSLPVVVLFQYGAFLTLATSERTKYKQTWREGEKVGKVSLLRDIDIQNPHTGHLKILLDLVIKPDARDFSGLYEQWIQVFDVQLLNKRFYKELANWYFWALLQVEFPDDAEKDKYVRNATSVIRLITRFIFVWFLKEKNLVPDALFDKQQLDDHLIYKDCNDSTYYKAILQNLFFATLNTKMKKDDPKSRKFVNRQYGIQEFYRYERFFKDKKKALKLFETIPFLNGGLFENLDKNAGKPDEVRIDCFTNSPKKSERLKVPDALFFGDEIQIDLSSVYGSKKRKKEKVRGLIYLLNSYKFTIDENTPIEEEIALDPELLGKVFENLLASYNPETQTTARKQTGSFYTPREIVNYMVDESLIEYLEEKLLSLSETDMPAEGNKEINNKLRNLLSYSTEDHLFTKKEVKAIINALDNSKILDPACGSGAFPMGMLHKMVHILSKIDHQNKQWKQRQIENQTREIKKDISYAEKIKDDKARQKALDELEKRLATIDDAFDNNELDYGRKLYLIENCIFGVDIQPIAVQIAKLRFFISLIVDQKTDEDKENLGILPLPNLETKFVAANTLIGIDKKGQLELNFQNPEIDKKEKELAEVRERHFSARTPKTKQKYREKDENLRNEIAALLEKEGFASDVTKKLVRWNPYDQNASAGFFDMEWMFGIKDGFVVVIGNPPYVRVDDIPKSLKPLYKSFYNTSVGKYDLYYLFFECGINYLSQKGILAYITPNKFCAANSGVALRNLIFNKFDNGEILSTSRLKVFEEVSNYPVISIFRTMSNKNIFSIRQALSINELSTPTRNSYELNNHILSVLPEKIIPINVSQKKIDLSVSLLSKFNVLGNYLSISEGLRIPKSYESEKKADNKIVKQYQFNKWSMIEDATYITNKDLLKVISKTSSRYQKIISDKILIAEDALSINATIDYKKYIPQGGIYFGALINDTYDIKVILSLLNSTVLSFIYGILFGGMHMGGGYLRYRKKFLEQLPISKSIKSEQKLIRLFAEKILNAKKTNHTSDTTTLEAEIDGRVAHLYNLTEEEYSLILKESNCTDPFRVAAQNIYRDIARGKIK